MLNKIKNLFTIKFPEEECVIQDPREKDIFGNSTWYWCLLQDTGSDEFTIKKLQPYGLNAYDNIDRPIHTDTLRIIGIGDKE